MMKYLKLFEGFINRLSKEDVRSIFEPIIDWDLIQDVKDMALEYLDDYLTLVISIKTPRFQSASESNIVLSTSVCDERYDHQIDHISWFSILHNHTDVEKDDLIYIFQLTPDENLNKKSKYYGGVHPSTEELVDRIKESYPNYNIRSRNI